MRHMVRFERVFVGVVLVAAYASGALAQRVSITVGDGGTGPFKAVLTSDESLTTHTLYRPRDLSSFGRIAACRS